MKPNEREAAHAVYVALSNVRFPASGSQSITVKGLAEFTAEMRAIMPSVLHVLITLSGGETYKGELADDVNNLHEKVKAAKAKGGRDE